MGVPEIDASDEPLVVLESFGPPHPMTNPYLTQLFRSLVPPIQPRYFSWRTALTGRYDAFHVHWPEVLLRGPTPSRTVARWTMFLLLLVRLRVQRKALVRTLHNLAPHEAPTGPQSWLLRLCDRWTTLWITMSAQVLPPRAVDTVLAPHGHYRDWYASAERHDPTPGRLLYVGLIRRYKGVDALLRAFAEAEGSDLALRIAGRVLDEEIGVQIRSAEAGDDRISSVDAYLSDEQLTEEIFRAELVVLPFTTHTNSGSLLLALSLDRPVLVPAGPVVDEIAAEVGPGWVLTYAGDLSGSDLRIALEAVRERSGGAGPDLSARDWSAIGERHAEAFLRALEIAHRRDRVGIAGHRHRIGQQTKDG